MREAIERVIEDFEKQKVSLAVTALTSSNRNITSILNCSAAIDTLDYAISKLKAVLENGTHDSSRVQGDVGEKTE